MIGKPNVVIDIILFTNKKTKTLMMCTVRTVTIPVNHGSTCVQNE